MTLSFYAGKSALITGGSSGIGLALAKQIVAAGGNVTVLARRKDLLDSAASQLEASRTNPDQKIIAVEADVTHREQLNQALDHYKAQDGVPDIVVNCAGVAHPGNFTATQPEIFHWMMDVNYFGMVNVLKNLVPDMERRKSGTIVNFSSIAGFIGVYGYTAYGASKYAVRGFSDVLRSELKIHCIKVSVVFPPDTQTPQLEYESKFKPFVTKEIGGSANLMTADAVAEEVLKKVARGQYIILPGPEGKMLYLVQNLLGRNMYWVMDALIRGAIKKIKFGKQE